jgi:hypothetical protein
MLADGASSPASRSRSDRGIGELVGLSWPAGLAMAIFGRHVAGVCFFEPDTPRRSWVFREQARSYRGFAD